MKRLVLLLVIISFISCGEETLPKPEGQLRLDYESPMYGRLDSNCSYSFDMNNQIKVKPIEPCSFELHYPKMKATVYLSYKNVNNNIENLLRDAQKLTYDHVIKADEIAEQPFINKDKKVYGMFYEVGGNAATNAQFYVTDSTKNFVVGSLYFYAKPNYDSILPAAAYIKNDIRTIMETIEWK